MSYNIVEIDPISGEHKLKKVAGLSKLNVWTGTQSDYNAQKNTIPNGSYVNITDDAESGNGIKDIYSTDEVKTNKVWINGKPIYRKVYTLATAISLSGSGNSNTPIENPYYTGYTGDIEEIVSFIHNPAKGVPYYEYLVQYFTSSLKFIQVATFSTPYTLPIGTKFIMEYTKTS